MDTYFQKRLAFLASKYGIANQKLQIEGQPVPEKEIDCRDLQIANDREAMKGFKTCIARVGKQKLWFDVKL